MSDAPELAQGQLPTLETQVVITPVSEGKPKRFTQRPGVQEVVRAVGVGAIVWAVLSLLEEPEESVGESP